MKTVILVTLAFWATTAPAKSIPVDDGAGLRLCLSDNGSVADVELNGKRLAQGGFGGFYLCKPIDATPQPLVGNLVSRNGTVRLTAISPLHAKLEASWFEGDGYIEVRSQLEDLTGQDRGLWLGFNVPVNTTGWTWGRSLSVSPTVTKESLGYSSENNLVPIPAIWSDYGGIALCIPPANPCVFEPWVMKALDHHHDWIGANYVNEEEHEDKTEHLINPNKTRYMAYTKTSGRIQSVDNVAENKTQQQVLDAIAATNTIQHYYKEAPTRSPELKSGREALINSVCYRSDQTFSTILKSKTSEIDFPINCDPDLLVDQNAPVFGRLFLRKTELIHRRGNYHSIHWDRVGGWGNSLNYRREHFDYVDHPLTFDQQGRVCIHTKLTHYELFDALRKQGKRIGLFHEAAGMKVYGWNRQPNRQAGHSSDGRFFTAALVAGGWPEGSFKPIELGGMDFERMVVGRKSYRISSGNIVAHGEPPTLEKVKRALAQTTAYGFACPVQIQYFYAPNRPGYSDAWSWINKPDHKALWESYEPANLAIRLAGWELVTHAFADSDAVQVERFGRDREVCFTVWGPNPPETASLEMDANALGLESKPDFNEIVSGVACEVSESPLGWRLTFPMEQNMTRVIRVQAAASAVEEPRKP